VTDYNHSTLPYELIIYSNTIINNLGTFDLKTKINTIQPQIITFEKIPEHLNSLISNNNIIITIFFFYKKKLNQIFKLLTEH